MLQQTYRSGRLFRGLRSIFAFSAVAVRSSLWHFPIHIRDVVESFAAPADGGPSYHGWRTFVTTLYPMSKVMVFGEGIPVLIVADEIFDIFWEEERVIVHLAEPLG